MDLNNIFSGGRGATTERITERGSGETNINGEPIPYKSNTNIEPLELYEDKDYVSKYINYSRKVGNYKEGSLTGYSYTFFTIPNLNVLSGNGYDQYIENGEIPDLVNQQRIEGQGFGYGGSNSADRNMVASNYFRYIAANHPEIIKLLTRRPTKSGNSSSYNNMFIIPLLTNTATNFSNSDTVLQTQSIGETRNGYKQTLSKGFVNSVAEGDFSISYRETSDLHVLKLHKMWVDYIHGVQTGLFIPSFDTIENRELDFTCSVYHFNLKPDGKTIQYWSKYTGVFPTAIPYSGLDFQEGEHEIVNFDVPYVFNYKEDMNPINLYEFNASVISQNKLFGFNDSLLSENFPVGVNNINTKPELVFYEHDEDDEN
jgi:hypothetical protein